jgi:hypothetical protein
MVVVFFFLSFFPFFFFFSSKSLSNNKIQPDGLEALQLILASATAVANVSLQQNQLQTVAQKVADARYVLN